MRRSDCADAKADLHLCRSHMEKKMFSHDVAHMQCVGYCKVSAFKSSLLINKNSLEFFTGVSNTFEFFIFLKCDRFVRLSDSSDSVTRVKDSNESFKLV